MLNGGEKITATDGTIYWVSKDVRFEAAQIRLNWNVLNFVEGPPLLIQSLVYDAVKGGAILEDNPSEKSVIYDMPTSRLMTKEEADEFLDGPK